MTFRDYDDGYEYDATRSADVPEDVYRCVITDLTTANHPVFGEEQARWSFRILDGEYAGQILLKWSSLDRTKRHYLFQDVARCGLAIRTLGELEVKLEKLKGREVEVKVQIKTSNSGKEYQAVWVNGLVHAVAAETPRELQRPQPQRPQPRRPQPPAQPRLAEPEYDSEEPPF